MPIRNPRLVIGAIAAIAFGCLIIFGDISCGDDATPEEKAQERARVATMEADLHKVEVGDILEFKDGDFCPVTHLVSGGCRISSLISGWGDNRHYSVLAYQVVKIHKRGTPRWKELAVDFMTPPYH